jgi:hypothetical protein
MGNISARCNQTVYITEAHGPAFTPDSPFEDALDRVAPAQNINRYADYWLATAVW